jgi:two-component system LytT family sensor kinase
MLPFVLSPRPKDASFIPEQTITPFFLIRGAFIIVFYYLNTYIFIPRLLARKKVVVYTLIILGLLILFGSFPRLYHFLTDDNPTWILNPASRHAARPRNFNPPLLSPGSITLFLLVFIFSTGVKAISQWFQTEQRNKEIENEKVFAELSFLKAQINPHFLFNTLNNIYSLAADRSEKTAAAVLKLSNIMRYVLTEAKNDLVTLEKEIRFTTHFIELQKMRLTDRTTVDFKVTGEPALKQITPLLFLPFVENAFKYGVSTRDFSVVAIWLEIGDETLHLMVKNDKHNGHHARPVENTGIGIHNSRRRLDLLYPGRHTLDIADEPSTYTVHLNIRLTCLPV